MVFEQPARSADPLKDRLARKHDSVLLFDLIGKMVLVDCEAVRFM